MAMNLDTLLNNWLYSSTAHHCSASSVRLEGMDIYSFGKHYLAARRGAGYILLNTYRYSMHTSAQLSRIWCFLRKECYKEDDILPFDSSLDHCPPWWVCNDKPPLGHVLSGLLLRQGTPSSRSLYTAGNLYGIDLGENGTIPSYLWGGDVNKLQDEKLLGRGEGSAVAVLHHMATDEGVEAAAAWVADQDAMKDLRPRMKKTLASLLVGRYGSLEVPAGSFDGFKKRFWDRLMALPVEARPEAAAEMLVSKPSLRPHAEAWLNSYNNLQHRRSSV